VANGVDQGVPLDHLIAANLRARRLERGMTQAQLASAMRSLGFNWTPNRVTQIETGRRAVLLEEFFVLALLLRQPITGWLKGDVDIRLPGGGVLEVKDVRAGMTVSGLPDDISWLIKGDPHHVEPSDEELRRVAARVDLSVGTVQALAMYLWGRQFFEERDRRAGSLSGLSRRSAQSKRGHATRALIAEMREHRNEFTHSVGGAASAKKE
jgi:transcriptional regulator with XRE-family HTH domain